MPTRGPDDYDPAGRIQGFAFAAFTCRAHAERAIADLNLKVRSFLGC